MLETQTQTKQNYRCHTYRLSLFSGVTWLIMRQLKCLIQLSFYDTAFFICLILLVDSNDLPIERVLVFRKFSQYFLVWKLSNGCSCRWNRYTKSVIGLLNSIVQYYCDTQ